MAEQYDKARRFRELQEGSETFVMPYAWDAASAMIFAEAGFQCIGTTSGSVKWVNGREDYVYAVPPDEMLKAYQAIAEATHLPASGDLENGYGDRPDQNDYFRERGRGGE